MASGDTGNVVPGNRLWVRIPCPPLHARTVIQAGAGAVSGPATQPTIQAGGSDRGAAVSATR